MEKSGFSSFLFGLGVGIGIGMLFAPKSGEETRSLIKNKAGEGADYVKRTGTDLSSKAGDLIDKGREMVGRQRDTLADAVQAGKQAYHETVGQQPGGPETMAQ